MNHAKRKCTTPSKLNQKKSKDQKIQSKILGHWKQENIITSRAQVNLLYRKTKRKKEIKKEIKKIQIVL